MTPRTSVQTLRERNTADLVVIATARNRTLARVHAIDELAIRALGDGSLLPLAIDAISGGRDWSFVQGGAPMGYLGAATLLGAERPEVTRALLEAMRGWARQEAEDLLRWWAGRQLEVMLQELRRTFGWELPER